jgi:hypothetical protein
VIWNYRLGQPIVLTERYEDGWRRGTCTVCGAGAIWNDITCIVTPACCGERLVADPAPEGEGEQG